MTRVNLRRTTPVAVVPPTHYATLGVSPGSNSEVLHAAYLELALQLHPDKGGDGERIKEINLAYGTLKNAELRKKYDAKLRLERRACKECTGRGLLRKSNSFTTVREVECELCGGAGYL